MKNNLWSNMKKGVNATIDVPEDVKKQNCSTQCLSIIYKIRHCFSLTGERRVRRSQLIKVDFKYAMQIQRCKYLAPKI